MAPNNNTSADQSLQHFRDHGWMRVAQAFTEGEALAMRGAIWRSLIKVGIHADRPATWSVERPTNLERLIDDPVFQAIGGRRLMAAIDLILDGRRYAAPENWGAFLIAFPSTADWYIPSRGWHIDASYTSALWPATGVKTHALLGDVDPRGGGTLILSGSPSVSMVQVEPASSRRTWS